ASADEHEGVEHLQEAAQIGLVFGWRQNDGDPASRLNGAVVASGNEAEGGALLARRAKVSIQTNEQLGTRHRKSLSERRITRNPLRERTPRQIQRPKRRAAAAELGMSDVGGTRATDCKATNRPWGPAAGLAR